MQFEALIGFEKQRTRQITDRSLQSDKDYELGLQALKSPPQPFYGSRYSANGQ